jgi:NADH:ubiquinone oxidoreductase subunit E
MIEAISNVLDISPAEVHGVVTFYSFLNTEPKGKYIIRLCKTISCDMAGKDRIVRVLQKELGIEFGQTTRDGLFSLEFTNCIGMCNEGPAMLVNEDVYSHLTPEKVVDILDKYRDEVRKRA